MTVIRQREAKRHLISPTRERYLAHGANLMLVAIDITDEPRGEPDPFHNHPHEQVTYVVEGRINFLMGDEQFEMGEGDMIAVPPNIPHAIQPLTPRVRLLDAFNPIREDFLG